jgi:hypothetical protein
VRNDGPTRSGLPLLIRLARQTADERRGQLARAQVLVAELREALAGHERQVEAEGRAAADGPGARAAYPGWVMRAARRRAELAAGLDRAEREEARRREALGEAFAAAKRLELAAGAAEAAAARSAARRAQATAEEQAALGRAAEAGNT